MQVAKPKFKNGILSCNIIFILSYMLCIEGIYVNMASASIVCMQ